MARDIDGPGVKLLRPPIGAAALPVREGSSSIGVELLALE